MVNLVAVDPATIGTTKREGRRGRVSYPIIKAFLESGVVCMKIDPTSTEKKPEYLRSVLTSYIKSHGHPIKLFSEGGELHLLRIDLDEQGNIDPNWQPEDPTETASEGSLGNRREMEPVQITLQEVDRRAAEDHVRSTE